MDRVITNPPGTADSIACREPPHAAGACQRERPDWAFGRWWSSASANVLNRMAARPVFDIRCWFSMIWRAHVAMTGRPA
jgi:hypothetical protein